MGSLFNEHFGRSHVSDGQIDGLIEKEGRERSL